MKISLKGARVNAGLKVGQVAEKLGVTVDTIWNYEKGKTQPKLPALRVLAELYGCKVEDFKEVSGE